MKQALDTRTKLLTKNPWPLMIELSIPAVLGMVVVGLYNMMDSIFVGQMVGDVQMGAISVSYPLTLINAGSAAMLGVGSASVLSRAIGKKDENTIKKIPYRTGGFELYTVLQAKHFQGFSILL